MTTIADPPLAPATTQAVAPTEMGRRIWAIVAGSLGNLVEWYDFYVYSFAALYFAAAFFPRGDQTAQLLNAAAVYGAGFLMRPLGAWFFGRFADQRGRRTAMLLAVSMMCAGSACIALMPTYKTVGAFAPLLLLLVRLVQGFSLGGEYGISATYMSEVAVTGRRGFLSSFQYVTLIGGQLAAVLVIFVLQQFITEQALHAWGWRVPFALGAVLAVVTFLLQRRLEETAPDETRGAGAGTMRVLVQHWRGFVTVLGVTSCGSLIFYAFTTYMQKYLVNTVGMSARTATAIMTGALFGYMVMQPIFGLLSDFIGRKTQLIIFGVLATLCTVPIFTLLQHVHSPLVALVLILAALAIVSVYTSISGLFKAQLFPIEVRALGVGLAFALANAVFGGSAEYVALWLKQAGHEPWFYWYVTGMSAIALGVAIVMRDLEKHGTLK